jgi:threonine aldolase
VARLADGVDSVSLDFTKGLSCPVGAVLAGSRDAIATARRRRRAIGGGMRQAGVIAAPCLVALASMVERLAEDHATARALARGLADVPGFEVDPERVETNIVLVGVGATGGAEATVAALRSIGILAGAVAADEIRLVTHRHVTPADVDEALERLRGASAEGSLASALG